VRPPTEAVTLRDSDPQVQNPVLILQKLVAVPESDRWSSRGARLLLADFLQSRLDGSPHEVLVEGSKLATGIGLDLSRLAPRQVALTVRVPLDGGQAPEKVVEAVEAYLRDLARSPISAETIERLRTRRLERRVLALAEPQRVADEVVDWLSGNDRFEDLALWPDRFRAVSAEQVAAYAAALAEPSRRVVGILTPREP
jgi:zinc protease